MRVLAVVVVLASCWVHPLYAQALPAELATQHFTVTVDGHPVTVAHAAANYYFANFDMKKPVTVSITAEKDDYWQSGVEVQPWRLGIRPERHGRTISFRLKQPAKLSITRPNDFLADAEMLFLFANHPDEKPPAELGPKVRVLGPGVYRENLQPASGETIYLAPGAVVLGSLNLWNVSNVHVYGRGIIVHDGPQNPKDDEGWMQKIGWHAIWMDHAQHITIEGITCVVRSRTWMIQMKDSRDVRFDNVKVIGGSASNANQDGMDWLGGGDTVVNDSFFRTADDVFALQGNWDGYDAASMAAPGHEVNNIVVQNSVLSTSISNIVRAAWPQKSFDSHNFTLRDTDVLHAGLGGCVVPFALLEIWSDPGGKGKHSGYLFDNVRVEDWYSLVQLRQPAPEIGDIQMRDVTAFESPSMAPSMMKGNVSGVSFENVSLANTLLTKDADVPLMRLDGSAEAAYNKGAKAPHAAFRYSTGIIAPHQDVRFDAGATEAGDAKIVAYHWVFGDGKRAEGRVVNHAFDDAEGTLLDHSGRFRVLLEVVDANGRTSWAYEPVVVTESANQATSPCHSERSAEPAFCLEQATQPGVTYKYLEGQQLTLDDVKKNPPVASGETNSIDLSVRKRDGDYGLVFEGLLDAPVDGGYTFTLLANDAGSISIDSTPVAISPAPWPNVCGLAGSAVQRATGSVALRAGKHQIRVAMTHHTGENGFRVLWQGPGIELSTIPASALSHGVMSSGQIESSDSSHRPASQERPSGAVHGRL